MTSNRIRIVAIVIAFVGCAASASPANAEHSRNGGEDGPGTATVSPYAVPIDAFGGMTMAQYIQNHQSEDPRTIATV